MAEKSKISWTDSTLNFWEGCTKVSAGCANCYAETRDKHWHGGAHWGPSGIRRKSKSAVKDAMRFNRLPWVHLCGEVFRSDHAGEPSNHWCEKCGTESGWHLRRIFSLSLGDWLEGPPVRVVNGVPFGGVPVEWRVELLDTVWKCPDVEFILCTKRIEDWLARMMEARDAAKMGVRPWIQAWLDGNPPKNVTILASVENQEQADARIPALLRIPAARRGLSLEPLLGPVVIPAELLQKLQWLIIGGESGQKARTCNVDWIRSLVQQGKAAGVSTFVKQLGSNPTVTMTATNRHGPPPDDFRAFSDRKGADPSEWPEDLRVQHWPEGM